MARIRHLAILTEDVQRLTVPAINTPETFTAFMHKELERQRELAKLSGHQTQIK